MRLVSNHRVHTFVVILLLLLLAGVAIYVIFVRTDETIAPDQEVFVSTEDTVIDAQTAASDVIWNPPENYYQELVEQWAANHRGEYAAVIVNPDTSTVLAQYNENESFFAASIYKLYVAYTGYLLVDNGEYNLNDVFLNSKTVEQCLDEMIRDSDSPCAEKMWVQIGKEALTDQLRRDYGLQGTSMTAITTTAGDAAIILGRLARGDDLSESSSQKLLVSMKDQIYTDTLDTALPDATVYNKIGFNLLLEYHDVALVDFGDGRRLVVSILTNGAGTKNIRGLAQAIADALPPAISE